VLDDHPISNEVPGRMSVKRIGEIAAKGGTLPNAHKLPNAEVA
jgi:hypothetical protein